jgi:hypothetical protein
VKTKDEDENVCSIPTRKAQGKGEGRLLLDNIEMDGIAWTGLIWFVIGTFRELL